LKPGQQHSEKHRISNKEDLEKVFGYIEEQLDDCDVESLQVLFIYPDDASPDSSPNKNLLEIIEEVKSDSTSNKSDSTKSSRDTIQKRFARELAVRDVVCRLCGEERVGFGCHIVDAKAKLTAEVKHTLEITTTYEVWNGILLCPTCHHLYDHWQIGIDEEGYKWEKVSGRWTRNEIVNIFETPDLCGHRQFPSPKLLKWKFDQFVKNRKKVVLRLACSFTALFVTTPPKPRKRSAKK
jgi:hypothetical protein